MIRALTPGDLAALLPLVEALARHHGDDARANVGTLFRDFFGTPPWLQGQVATDQGLLVGYAALLPKARLHLGERGMDLHHLFVHPEARGKGLGRALLDAALAHARAQGCAYLTVTAHPANDAAKRFYAAMGFHAAPPAPDRFAIDLSGLRPGP